MTWSSWGRLQKVDHHGVALSDRHRAGDAIRGAVPGLPYGMGRSYGDECLNPGGNLWLTSGLDRFMGFCPETGVLRCEGGVLLKDIQETMLQQGWMLPVTPGTQFVTVGGAIANDVHGKNHHVMGAFGHHVRRLLLTRTDGQTLECSPTVHEDWFKATVGGMGLTGLILEADIQLRRVDGPWLETETIPYANLKEFFQLADSSEAAWEYTVSWIDCINGGGERGLFMRGRHSRHVTLQQAPRAARTMPLTPPVSMVNALTLRAFNVMYFNAHRWRPSKVVQHYQPFFYPLDNLLHWNRMYGPRGFYQYQCVVPRDVGHDSARAMLKTIARSGQGSFLAVLKTFGQQQSLGMLSFPKPGVTLALDFPNRGDATLKLFEQLDAIVRQARGRLYPAKDARMPRDLFVSGYSGLNDFLPYRDPGISSAMARRLMD